MIPRTPLFSMELLGVLLLTAEACLGPAAASAADPARLEVDPPTALLVGPLAEQQISVRLIRPGAGAVDVTKRVSLAGAYPAVQFQGGVISARKDGRYRLTLKLASGRSAITTGMTLDVRESESARPVSFAAEVVPALTRAGCNQGACHGGQFGRGGLKLSLLGYAPEADYAALVRDGGGRRVNRTRPEQSLLLLKATMAVPHAGGLRLPEGSLPRRILSRWLADGAPAPLASEPSLTRVSASPSAAQMARGDRRQTRLTAHYNDGRTADVTRLALIQSGGEGVANVDGGGLITAAGSGIAPIVARYQGKVAVVRVLVPFPRPALPLRWQATNLVDEEIGRGWERLGLRPSEEATPAEFLRRVSLDLTGTLPTRAQLDQYLQDAATRPDAADRLVDRLLQTEEWVDFWALYFGDLLRNTKKTSGEKGMWALHNWLRTSLRDGKPFNQMVGELIGGHGSTVQNAAANFYNAAATPEDLAETTSQVFLGIRLQCARCHNHPFERWTQNDYYGLAAFFPGVKRKQSPTEVLVLHTAEGKVDHPRTGSPVKPHTLDGPDLEPDAPARPAALAEWLASPSNPFVARTVVNRVWGRLMGRGLIEPVDDIRSSNPPSHPELLDRLTEEFIRAGFDLRALMRRIVTSRTYRLSSRPTQANEADDRYYSHALSRRLMAEQLLDAISAATGKAERFPGLPASYRAISLPDPSLAKVGLLDTFGRPTRATVCECERSNNPNLSQSLFLLNSGYMQNRIADDGGRIALGVRAGASADELVRDLYAATFTRYPSPDEMKRSLGFLGEAQNIREGLEDLLWTLLNSQEFLLQH